MKTAKRRTNKRKNTKRGGGWFWNDATSTTAPTEQKSSWGSWFSGMFGAKKPADVGTSAPVSEPPTPANTPETASAPAPAPAPEAQSTGGKRKTSKRRSKK